MKTRKTGRTGSMLILALMMVIALMAGWCLTGLAEEQAETMTAARTPRAGDTEILLNWPEETANLQANVFAGETELFDSATLAEGVLTLRLNRALEKGETVQIYVAEGEGEPESAELTVLAALNAQAAALEEKLVELSAVWQDTVHPLLAEGKVYLPLNWKEIPFVIDPEEAPEITVTEEDGQVTIQMEGLLPDGWKVAMGAGLPVQMTDCAYDAEAECWQGSGTFDSIYLTREMEGGDKLNIEYAKANAFKASYPEWSHQVVTEEATEAGACYGWGTAEAFQGGMYALVMNDLGYYATYAADSSLDNYMDAMTGRTYDATDKLMDGEEPEGFVNPVVHEVE